MQYVTIVAILAAMCSWDNSVSTVTRIQVEQPRNWGSILGRWRFFLSNSV
jgi:hypothetical protein